MQYSIVLLLMIYAFSNIYGQAGIGSGGVKLVYEKHCSSCHDSNLRGGLGPSLLVSDHWKSDGSDQGLANAIRKGAPDFGMPAYENILSEKQIRSLVIYIRELQHRDTVQANIPFDSDLIYQSEDYRFKLKEVFSTDGMLWSVEGLSENTFIVTDKAGKLYIYENQNLVEIQGIPEVLQLGQGGLLDVAIDTDYWVNDWIYISYTGYGSKNKKKLKAGLTQVARGKIRGNRWVENQLLFEAPLQFYSTRGVHFGSRILLDGDHLFFSIGDRGNPQKAQDLRSPYGKIYRIFKNGETPDDNPFVEMGGFSAAIWSYGHRNPQGLAIHPETQDIWASEHGPRGGDEINKIQKGFNYGWPVISNGMNYSGTPITELTEKDGMESPIHQWTPSIAVCGLDIYRGELFKKWRNDILAGGLASKQLHRLRIRDDQVIKDEILFKGVGRVRDVKVWKGEIYILVNDKSSGRSILYKLAAV